MIAANNLTTALVLDWRSPQVAIELHHVVPRGAQQGKGHAKGGPPLPIGLAVRRLIANGAGERSDAISVLKVWHI